MSKIQYNVGYLEGQLGAGILFSAITDGGTLFLVYKHQVTIGGVPTDKYMFLAKSALEAHMLSKKAFVASDINVSVLPESAPQGILDSDGYVTISNDNTTLSRVYNNQAPYTLKGTGVGEYTGKDVRLVTGSESQTVVISSSAKTISENITDLVAWGTKNWYIVLAIAIAISELLGWTNFLGLNKKKTARRRR